LPAFLWRRFAVEDIESERKGRVEVEKGCKRRDFARWSERLEAGRRRSLKDAERPQFGDKGRCTGSFNAVCCI